MQFETRCVHVGVDKDSTFNSATTPIYPSSTFRWDYLKTHRGFDYTRSAWASRIYNSNRKRKDDANTIES